MNDQELDKFAFDFGKKEIEENNRIVLAKRAKCLKDYKGICFGTSIDVYMPAKGVLFLDVYFSNDLKRIAFTTADVHALRDYLVAHFPPEQADFAPDFAPGGR